MAAGGRSWMNAAVLSRNIAMSGTFSHRITAAARSLASACLSLNVPSAAYTSIIGIGRLLQLQTLKRNGGWNTQNGLYIPDTRQIRLARWPRSTHERPTR